MPDPKKPTRPIFASVQKTVQPKTPEELFASLTGRAQTHGFLRGQQQDVLREYAAKYQASSDVAAELPTGTGKTTVGLLIAEWHRLGGKRVAYLSLTNQLASQVLEEGTRLGVRCADLRGKKDERDASEEGRFRNRAAIGVSTYSNLFNANPVIKECDLLILDDAHGAEQHVADMWTVTVRRSERQALFNSLLSAVRPALTDSAATAILGKAGRPNELIDLVGHPEIRPPLAAALDRVTEGDIHFPWSRISTKLDACLVIVTNWEITIRPVMAPTHIHEPFSGAAQRFYMSATLGGESDLRRAYCRERLDVVRAKSSQWGRRYIFVPGVYLNAEEAQQVAATAWDRMSPKRAVLLAPSEVVMNRAYDQLNKLAVYKPKRFGADHIQDSVDAFVTADNAMLTLAGRYDGLDLPDEDCRLLIMVDSPSATNALERHLSERWKLGPVLRRRERTRLIQGMGRCTRGPVDFAVIIWLGQSLVNASVSEPLLSGMPGELAAEIAWGLKQVEAAKTIEDIDNLIAGLLEDPEYRAAANESIADRPHPEAAEPKPDQYDDVGIDEVRFAKAVWDEDFENAHRLARKIADKVTADGLEGYRAWWWYQASIAARLIGNAGNERDALVRAASCGVNSGWIKRVLIHRSPGADLPEDNKHESNAEPIFELLDDWGWAGVSFDENVAKMLDKLQDVHHSAYHEGLDLLGKCLGAETTRTTDQGAPDVVWVFPDGPSFTFEAKTEKLPHGALSKKDLLEAAGHINWVVAHLSDSPKTDRIEPIVVSPEPRVLAVGMPHIAGLWHLKPDPVLDFAQIVASWLTDMRVTYAGRDYASAAAGFSAEIRAKSLTVADIESFLRQTSLQNVAVSV